jgi:hypothetical protein
MRSKDGARSSGSISKGPHDRLALPLLGSGRSCFRLCQFTCQHGKLTSGAESAYHHRLQLVYELYLGFVNDVWNPLRQRSWICTSQASVSLFAWVSVAAPNASLYHISRSSHAL